MMFLGSENLRPVEARVIEFPLKGDVYTGLPGDVFPGPMEQMLAIMQGDRFHLMDQFDPWFELSQMLLRLHEYLDERFYDVKGTFMFWLGKADEWMRDGIIKRLGLTEVEEFIYEFTFFGTFAVFSGVLMVVHAAKDVMGDFLGSPRRGDWILGEGGLLPPEDSFNIWEEMMHGFADSWNSRKAEGNEDEGITEDSSSPFGITDIVELHGVPTADAFATNGQQSTKS